jgi:hypothetical protein
MRVLKCEIQKCEKSDNKKKMVERKKKKKKKNRKISCLKRNCLITNLGTKLFSSQQGLAKTNPYAYQPVFICKKKQID